MLLLCVQAITAQCSKCLSVFVWPTGIAMAFEDSGGDGVCNLLLTNALTANWRGEIGCGTDLTCLLWLQALPWILDVGYTILAVALLVAMLGHLLFGDFESTMTTLPDSISGDLQHCLFG